MPKKPEPWWREDRQAWFVQINRKRHNLGKDKQKAWQRYFELMAQPQKRVIASDSLAAIIDAFLEWTSKNRSPDTYEWYRYRLQRFIERYPRMRADELRPYHVETWADGHVQCVTSRRNYLRSVKRCMKWAKKQGYIDSNPIADMEVPAAEAREVYIPPNEFAVFRSFVRNESLADLVDVTYDCGCRPQELLRVTAKEVDLTNERWVFSRSGSKGKRLSRVVYLPDIALAITKRLLIKHGDGGPLFRNSDGRPWTTDAVNSAFLAVRMRIGKAEMKRRDEVIAIEDIAALIPKLNSTKTLKGQVFDKSNAELRAEAKRKLTYKRAAGLATQCSLYALRHSWATNALKKGVDALTVAILMGHADPSTLSKVYQHLSLNPEHMLKQAKRAAG